MSHVRVGVPTQLKPCTVSPPRVRSHDATVHPGKQLGSRLARMRRQRARHAGGWPDAHMASAESRTATKTCDFMFSLMAFCPCGLGRLEDDQTMTKKWHRREADNSAGRMTR